MGAKPNLEAAEAVRDSVSLHKGAARPAARAARADDVAAESPALQLQASLRESFADPVPDRWSARRTLAFVVGASGAFWVAAALLVQLAGQALG